MADEQNPEDRGPVEEGNGGPVTPHAGLPHGTHGNGTNGLGALPAVREPEGPATVVPESEREPDLEIKHTRISGLWTGIILSAVVLVLLLVFIVQNIEPARIRFFGAEGSMPIGVALLFAAALGVLLVAIPGYLRILQLRRLARKRSRTEHG
ncbi:hypothetical protein GCM10023321_41880 [Pseudonocardia eucalypti]|uniref:Lipopolysaccharide assembly protein A domain-containing protein n=1 Tax=Pseudonocardia eucalypti TaxID=648755 RepID=A0ABP9QDB2_9PSEU|nr:putative integral membrane protein [Pseudonocardia eucalypti]